MFDKVFVTELASQIAAKLMPQIHNGNGRSKAAPRLLTVQDAATYIGRTVQAVQHLIHRRELVVVRKAGVSILIEAIWTAGSRQTSSDLRQPVSLSPNRT